MAFRVLPHSLMGRALLIVVAPMVILQVLTAYTFYENHWDQVSKRLALGLAGDIIVIVDALRELPDETARQWMLTEAARRMDLEVEVLPGGVLTRTAGEAPIEGELRRALLAKDIGKPVNVNSVADPTHVIVTVQLPDALLVVRVPRYRLFSKTTTIFVLWTVGMSLLLLGVATLFMRSQVKPVLRLARVADEFGKGRDVADFRPQGAKEVRQAAVAFLAMRSRIQRQLTQRTAMLAGVSHDLRTPLTRMKLQLEMMGTDESVAALKEDIVEMQRMLEGYLAFARGEGGEPAEFADLGTILDDVVRQARRQGGQITLDLAGDLLIPIKPDAIRRCLANLLDNARRYATHVAVRAERRPRAIEVIIDDDGPGIPVDQREEVFRPFFRLEQSRNPNTGGVGLGLAIARDVAHGHGGKITLGDSPSGGLRVLLRLPL